MTAFLRRTLVDGHTGARIRCIAIAMYALAVTAAAAAWLPAVDGVAISNATVRDALVALPVMAVAAWFAIRGCQRLMGSSTAATALVMPGLTLSLLVATIASALRALVDLGPEVLFGTRAGTGIDAAAFVVERAMVAAPAHLAAAGLITAILAVARPWRPSATTQRGRRAVGRGAKFAIACLGVTAFATNALLGHALAPTASAAADTPSACPAGATIRDYRVKTIDVDITLNRFGDHDPLGRMYVLTGFGDAERQRRVGDGALATYLDTGQEQKVRTQEASRHVSIGLRDDPIQPLVIRGNIGECIEIAFTNGLSTDEVGMHVDGLAFSSDSSGDSVGRNASSAVAPGGGRTYRYYIPDEPDMEGVRYLRPGAGRRALVSHGLFGAFVVEPKDAKYLSSYAQGEPLTSGWGWEAIIVPPEKKAFREHVKLFHEIGDETYKLKTADGHDVEFIDPHTSAYRPDSRAINYRSEPFMNRLDAEDRAKAFSYNTFTFGDPPTPMPQSYLGDPTKIRILHAGSEMLHVYHLHGGGIRWRLNPQADAGFDYQETGLDKSPKTNLGNSQRLDSQSQGPGEGFDLEIEGGAGGVQQSAGDFLFHCHIAEHYVAGMWSFWRVFDTHQPGLATLPDRKPLTDPVDSSMLIGKTFNGTTITTDNLKDWVEPQLPPKGAPLDWDGSVWNWTAAPDAPNLYLGAPEDTASWANLLNTKDDVRPWDPGGVAQTLQGHPGLLAGDQVVGNRPKILFNPANGRPAYPLFRAQIGQRAPFSPNGHSGAPWLGERADQDAVTPVAPWAGRGDGICPASSTIRRFNLVSIGVPIQVTRKGATDPLGKLFVLAADKDGVRNGSKPKEPLALRANQGDCAMITLTSEQEDDLEQPFSSTNAHIHHVQFDVQASDGVGTGLAYGQAVRPYRLEDTTLAAAVGAGDSTISLAAAPATSADGLAKFREGVWIAVGEGTEGIEIRRIEQVDGATVTLNQPLANAHPAGEWTGTEFVRYIWYPDVVLDNIFWHDHVDGIHNWGHGLVGQFIVEPPGSTYHDPATGEQVRSGTIVDVRTSSPVLPGVVEKSFREFALWTIDENPATESTVNLRAEPFGDRTSKNSDPSLLFSSYTHGDPFTPIPRAYPGDSVVIRTINVSPGVDTFVLDGHTFSSDPRLVDGGGKLVGTPRDAVPYGISERYTIALGGGAGGALKEPGDYLYRNGIGRRFRQGAWGLIRVLGGQTPSLKPLPENPAPTSTAVTPRVTGGRPPDTNDPGTPCPAGAPTRPFAVSAVKVPSAPSPTVRATFVPTADAQAVMAGTTLPEPLVLHAAQGECIEVRLTNRLSSGSTRVSFHVGEIAGSTSLGINTGFGPEQTVARDKTRTYRFFARDARVGAALVSDFGGLDTGPDGLYGAVVIAPAGAQFRDPTTGAARDIGAQIDVLAPNKAPYRDMTLIMADDDPIIGQNAMPYPRFVSGPSFLNLRVAGTPGTNPDTAGAFSSAANGGDPPTVLRAVTGDRIVMHVLGAPGSEQIHMFGAGGLPWRRDADVPRSEIVTTDRVGPGVSLDVELLGAASAARDGDYIVGDMRLPFTQAGMWGLLRVSPPGAAGAPKALTDPFPSQTTPSTPNLASLALSPASIVGGASTTGTVTLTAAAPSGGAVVTLTSANAAVASVPASVTVAAGALSATFPAATSAVTAQATVALTAAWSGVTRTAALTVNAAAPTTPAALPAPALISPAAGARFSRGQTITFDWSDVTGGAAYSVQIDDQDTFASPIASPTVTASTLATATLPATRMWWRVRANDASGHPGAWSAVRRIEVR